MKTARFIGVPRLVNEERRGHDHQEAPGCMEPDSRVFPLYSFRLSKGKSVIAQRIQPNWSAVWGRSFGPVVSIRLVSRSRIRTAAKPCRSWVGTAP